MPTSVPGLSNRRDFPRRPALARGFTLLEILVVVAIIGIFIGVTVLSTDLVNYERRMEQEAKRLGTILGFASDEALLQSKDFGLLICEDGYHFFIYDYDVGDWVPYAVKPFEARMLDDDMQLALRLDDSDVVLKTSDAAYPPNWSLPLSDAELEKMPDPQITILSSGEITPFQLEFLRASELYEPGVALNVAFNGEYEVARSDN
jgi:general secretion pathway protein H